MMNYALRRLVGTVPVLLLVATITFIVVRVMPGDLAELRLCEAATPEAVSEGRVSSRPRSPGEPVPVHLRA